VRVIRQRLHDASVLAERTKNLGISGNARESDPREVVALNTDPGVDAGTQRRGGRR
jgi:hypothetical protein